MIHRIEAKNKKDGRIYTWDRQTIGDIIENIPKLIKLDGFYEKTKIYEKY
jgi:hypothetical protein